jgi:hypothetical protein
VYGDISTSDAIKGESYRLREKLKAGLLKPKLDPLQPDGA